MNNIHKTLLISTAFFFTFQIAFSQKTDITPKQEIGVTMGTQASFSVLYKKERKDGHYNRLEGTAGSISYDNNDNDLVLNAAIQFIKEKRKYKGDRFFFSYGPGLGLSTSLAFTNEFNRTSLIARPSFLYLLGANYKLNDKIYVGAELKPSASINLNYNSNRDDINFSTNLGGTTSARIHIAYRFEG